MSLIIASGSNLEDCFKNLSRAKEKLSQYFKLLGASRIYVSKAVEYLDQPDFYNQVLEFSLPEEMTPREVMTLLLIIEKEFGRNRMVPKGPRTLDLDIIFWGDNEVHEPHLIIPHPRWLTRSFVVKPFSELPYFKEVEKRFKILESFEVDAFPLDSLHDD